MRFLANTVLPAPIKVIFLRELPMSVKSIPNQVQLRPAATATRSITQRSSLLEKVVDVLTNLFHCGGGIGSV